MALLPPHFLDAVIAIGRQAESPNEEPIWIGTGFGYGKKMEEDGYRPFLVTNKHVIAGDDDLVVAVNMESGPAQLGLIGRRTPDGRELWTGHPDPNVDIAVTDVKLGDLRDAGGTQRFFMSDADILPVAKAMETGVAEGDGVYVLGFPLGVVGRPLATPIVRQGIVARCRDLFAGTESEYLIDANVFPGNSGGPVVLKPEMVSIDGTSPNPNALLIGIAQAYLPYQDIAVSSQTNRPKVIFEENSGIAPVIPVDRIDETIDAWFAAKDEFERGTAPTE